METEGTLVASVGILSAFIRRRTKEIRIRKTHRKKLHTSPAFTFTGIVSTTPRRVGTWSTEDRLKHIEAFQLGEPGKVEAIEGDEAAKDGGTLRTGEAEKAHRGEVHARQLPCGMRLIALKIGAVDGSDIGEDGILEVKIASFAPEFLPIGLDSQESRQAEEEDDMEIGVTFGTGIEPSDGIHQIIEEILAEVALQSGVGKELGKKHDDGHLVGLRHDRVVALGRAHRTRTENRGGRTGLPHDFKMGKGAEKARTHR